MRSFDEQFNEKSIDESHLQPVDSTLRPEMRVRAAQSWEMTGWHSQATTRLTHSTAVHHSCLLFYPSTHLIEKRYQTTNISLSRSLRRQSLLAQNRYRHGRRTSTQIRALPPTPTDKAGYGAFGRLASRRLPHLQAEVASQLEHLNFDIDAPDRKSRGCECQPVSAKDFALALNYWDQSEEGLYESLFRAAGFWGVDEEKRSDTMARLPAFNCTEQ
ncbi:MAG: hypothetical protein LQ346_008489 [Caloplaca aetnensis]|nr:MAG: hypothetical protein LQ346_008489 [Caloplaca aetnensis]